MASFFFQILNQVVFFTLISGFSSVAIARPQPNPTGSTIACEKDMSFSQWLTGFKAEALAEGISESTFANALPYMKVDPSVLKKDRAQGVFAQTFLEFSDRMASETRRTQGIKRITTTYKNIFEKIERDFGVPAAPIVSFWALESDFGTFTGNFSTFAGITTLAYDCRRADFFRSQLIDALKLVQRGDLSPSQMIGNWAGELGATQFMATDYLESGVDYDGDGKVNLIKSTPDTLASSANFLLKKGWVRGQPWLQEVHVPADMPWQEADLAIQHPVSQWVAWGVVAARGHLPSTDYQASLVLPMGRLGPAFLAYPNFRAILGWNASLVYSTTAAYFATRLAGAPAVSRGSANLKSLTAAQIVELQGHLLRLGFNIGKVDGKLGLATRAAVKQMQIRLNLPADSYPTEDLLIKLRGT